MLTREFYEQQAFAAVQRAEGGHLNSHSSFASKNVFVPAAKEDKGPMNFLLDLAAGGTWWEGDDGGLNRG